MKKISKDDVIKINLKYNHVRWAPKISIEFRAIFLRTAEKEAEELSLSFKGEYDYEIIDDNIYYYPIYRDNDNELIKGKYVKIIEL